MASLFLLINTLSSSPVLTLNKKLGSYALFSCFFMNIESRFGWTRYSYSFPSVLWWKPLGWRRITWWYSSLFLMICRPYGGYRRLCLCHRPWRCSCPERSSRTSMILNVLGMILDCCSSSPSSSYECRLWWYWWRRTCLFVYWWYHGWWVDCRYITMQSKVLRIPTYSSGMMKP